MTTNCDLEEMKHAALQAFLALPDDVHKWSVESRMSDRLCYGKWAVNGNYLWGYAVYLKGKRLTSFHPPEEKWYKLDGKLSKSNKALFAKDTLEYKTNPVVVKAAALLKERHKLETIEENERKCKEIQKDLNNPWWKFW